MSPDGFRACDISHSRPSRRLLDFQQMYSEPHNESHRKRLACGAVSCGGCVKECGVVLYRYLAGLDLKDELAKEEAVLPVLDDSYRAQNS